MVECSWAQKVMLSMSCLLGAVVLDGCHWCKSASREGRSWSASAAAGILAASNKRSCAVYMASVKERIAGVPLSSDLNIQMFNEAGQPLLCVQKAGTKNQDKVLCG